MSIHLLAMGQMKKAAAGASISASYITGGNMSASATPTLATGTLAAGTYLIGLININGTNTISAAPTLEGTSATLKGSGLNANSKNGGFYEVTIAGGGSETLSVALTGFSNRCFAAIWKVENGAYVAESSIDVTNAAAPTADHSFTTASGDVVLAFCASNTTTAPTVDNMTLRVNAVVSNGKQFSAADNLSATGGSPEIFGWNFTEGFDDENVVAVHYGPA